MDWLCNLDYLLSMCSPVGHSLLGAAVSLPQESISNKKGWFIAGSIFIANLPDADHLLGWIQGDPTAYHRMWTHSVGFAIMVGALLGFVAKLFKWQRPFRWGLWGGVLILSHLVLDYFAKDTSEPFGIPILWPFMKRYFLSPVVIFSDLFKSPDSADFFQSLWVKHNLISMLREALILGPIFVAVWLVQRNRQKATWIK